MSLFAIADTHLSFGTNKPMDSFEGWDNYVARLQNNWNSVVTSDDTVVIAGDISWAMNFDELYKDFDFINKLNGKKIILKGNHDYWWSTISKMEKFVSENCFYTISFLHNNSYKLDGFYVCGSRGWMFDSESDQDKKIMNREVQRLAISIESAEKDAEKIVFLHYPPITVNEKFEKMIDLLKENGIKKCYYGHLHGVAAKFAYDGEIDGTDFKLISCDRLNFVPYLVKKF